jgi:hypothetical protein
MRSLYLVLRNVPLLPLYAGLGLTIGLIVPCAFEYTEEIASRTRHYALERGALVVIVITLLVCGTVMWLRRNSTVKITKSSRLQFGLRGTLSAMTLGAVVMALSPLLSATLASGLVAAVAIGMLGCAFIWGGQAWSRFSAMLAVMFLPFTWMIAFNVPFGDTSGLAIAFPLAPGLIIAELIRAFTGSSRDQVERLGVAIVILQLLLGAWLARRRTRLSALYTVLLLVTSSLSSFVLHALYRA